MRYEYFNMDEVKTLEDLKKIYKKLAFIYHPDMKNGDKEIFQKINNEYELLFELYKNKSENNNEKKENVNTFKDIINEFINYENITIEVVGYWVWISGKGTFNNEVRKKLDSIGFFYSGKNKCFMYNNGKAKEKSLRSKYSKGEIKEKYGCTVVNNNNDNNKKLK